MLKLAGLKKTYLMGETSVRALDGIDLHIRPNEFVAIMGPSGSGKSTLMNILGCLDRPSEGSYLLDGREVSQLDDDELSFTRNKHLGFVFQNFNLLPRYTAAVEARDEALFPELLDRLEKTHHLPTPRKLLWK